MGVRQSWATAGILLLAALTARSEPACDTLPPAAGLRELADFPVGVAVPGPPWPNDLLASPERQAIVDRHFSSLTAENIMKMAYLQPKRGRFDFAHADALVDYAWRHDLLVHGQIWIAALIAQGEARRALGVLQDCCGIDPAFVPDDPRTCGELADLADRLGMTHLAIHLGRGYLARWPRDPQTPRYGLLVARQLGAHAERRAEAIVLLERLAAAWPDHPQRRGIVALQRQLAGGA